MDKKTVEKELKDDMPLFTGTEYYWTHRKGGIKYTDGIKYVADTAEAHWIIDLVESYQPALMKAGKSFQIWTLLINNGSGTMTCKEDTGQPNLVAPEIKTDFPLDEFEFYCIDGVILLKGEY